MRRCQLTKWHPTRRACLVTTPRWSASPTTARSWRWFGDMRESSGGQYMAQQSKIDTVRPPEPSLEGLRTEQKVDEQIGRDLCRAVGTEQEQSGTASQENTAAAQQSPGTVGDVEDGSLVATISIPHDTPNVEAQIQRYVKPVTRLFDWTRTYFPPLLILANKAFLSNHLASTRSRSDFWPSPIVAALLTALLPPEHCSRDSLVFRFAVVDTIPGTTHADGCVRTQEAEEPQIAYAFHKHKFFNTQEEASLEPATLTLIFEPHGGGKDYLIPDTNAVHSKVQLPLANTTFVSGREYFQEFGRVRLTRQADGLRYWQCSGLSQDVRSGTAVFTAGFPQRRANQSSIFAPLVPLTAPRKVSASLGNIVRQVERNDEAVSASKELEDVVNEGIKNGVLPSGPVQVWALITGSDVITKTGRAGLSITQLSATHQKQTELSADSDMTLEADSMTGAELQRELKDMLVAGSRLHRVLSGGGGWGKKAGLISLSPAVEFGDGRSAAETEEGEAKAIQDVLGSPIQEGDHLQFLLASPMQKPAVLHQPEQGDVTMDFGTIPSTIDDVLLPKPQRGTQNESIRKDIVVMPDRFGALSEKGISIGYKHPNGDRETMLTSRTMLDVPHSRLRISWPNTHIPKKSKNNRLRVKPSKVKAVAHTTTAHSNPGQDRRPAVTVGNARKPSDSASELWEAAYNALCQFIRNQVEEEVQKRLGQAELKRHVVHGVVENRTQHAQRDANPIRDRNQPGQDPSEIMLKDSTEAFSGLPSRYVPIKAMDSEDQNLPVSNKAGAQVTAGLRRGAGTKNKQEKQKKRGLRSEASEMDSATEMEKAKRAEMTRKITAMLDEL